MRPEAALFIESLMNEKSGVLFSYNMESGNFRNVVLDADRITEEEYEKLMDFAKNGSPEISVEKRTTHDIDLF